LTPIQMRCPALWEGLQDRIDLLEKLRAVWLVGMLLRTCLRIPSARMGWVLRLGRLGSCRGGGGGCARLQQHRLLPWGQTLSLLAFLAVLLFLALFCSSAFPA